MERFRIKTAQMDSHRGLLCIRRMDRVLSAQIRELCSDEEGGGMKGLTKVFFDSSAIWKE